ncbi:aspartate carbamoyltransferase regulatory subunit [Haloimpatiens lingqiaonensis]|uniref:aspartate carbamoyltransferase regulatory subunit n=1 Tax=Haloimpatiens lingqiaonensis TaxID=1380675 RepID=UPI0010FDDED6|nr:aspartate carbamoyltransferase regulatory subunit [Haloimpatiens lingqiaonensis]
MLKVDSVKKGIVIDHIKAGMGMKIFNFLGLDKIDGSVALIMNACSEKMGKKDIIKIDNVTNMDLTMIGIMDPNATVNIIENEQIKEKIALKLPDRVEDLIKCKNPRCITSIEKYIPHVFYLVDREKGQYRCKYCDEAHNLERE